MCCILVVHAPPQHLTTISRFVKSAAFKSALKVRFYCCQAKPLVKSTFKPALKSALILLTLAASMPFVFISPQLAHAAVTVKGCTSGTLKGSTCVLSLISGGLTWTDQAAAGSRNWQSITSSSDGTKLAAAVINGDIWTSTNSGATWTDQAAAGSRSWLSITSSSDGTKLAAAVSGGHIWTGILPKNSLQNTTLTMPNNRLGLVGHWTFDGKDMIKNVADSSGQGQHGRTRRGSHQLAAGSWPDRPGVLIQWNESVCVYPYKPRKRERAHNLYHIGMVQDHFDSGT